MPNRNKAVGNDRELRAAKFMRTKGWPKARRRLAGRRLDEGDLENTGPVTWQVKRLKNGASRNLIRKWLQEAQRQSENADSALGVLLYVQEFKPVAQWSVYMYASDLAELTTRWADLLKPRIDTIIVRLDFEDALDLMYMAGYAEEVIENG